MAKKEFILQGFTARTHAEAVRELFDVPDIRRVLVSVSFVSEGGVQQIEAELRKHTAHVTVLAGIRNDITSHQGLARLHGIANRLYVVDTGSRTVLFHPKLYLVRGKKRAKAVVGSANLTLGGLNNNVEAGVLFDFDLSVAADKIIVDDIETQLDALPAAYPIHVVKVGTIADLDKMLASGRLVDETTAALRRPSKSATDAGAVDTVPRIVLKVAPIYRHIKKAKAAPTKPKAPKAMGKGAPTPALVVAGAGVDLELVWEGRFAARDLPIPKRAGTNPPGSFNLDKGRLPEEVDHRSYFREIVFSALTWQPASKTTEEAFASFHLVIKGISTGTHDLRIGHTTGTTSKSYKQKNAMTRLSWGPFRQFVARTDLLDRTVTLYRDKIDPTRFVLEID